MSEKTKICPNCGSELYPDAIRCISCGYGLPKLSNKCVLCGKEENTVFILDKEYCESCFRKAIANIKVSTTPYLEGYKIVENKGIDAVTVVMGTGLLTEISGEFSDFLGHRSSKFETKLSNAKDAALDKLRFSATSKGADAIVGLVITLTEFSNNMIGLLAYGTFVRIEKI